MTAERLVLVTVPSRDDGERIAAALVAEAVAACVNIVGPIRSIYRWNGEICRDDEHLLLIKTTESCYAALEARIKSLHSYDTPEIIAVPIERGSAEYLAWVRNSVTTDR